MVTAGDTAELELVTSTSMALAAFCHWLVSQGLAWHSALTAALLATDTLEPTATHPAALLTNAFTCRLLTHTHDDALAQAKFSTALQVNCVAPLPRSVLESKAMAMYDPSSAKVADVRTGAGSGSWAARTVIALAPLA
jgi:hypothetical protein